MTERSGASLHLQIPLHEYDARIRTFVPYYEEMLEQVGRVVAALPAADPVIVDLGTGTGALAATCLRARPEARIIGIDADAQMLEIARARLTDSVQVELRVASYLEAEIPASDLIVASISLHHVPEADAKMDLYARCRRALHSGGAMILADCYLPELEQLAVDGMAAWQRHLEGHYTRIEAERYLAAWAEEDRYFQLVDELRWLSEAGFRPDVIWRRDLFAVLLCTHLPH